MTESTHTSNALRVERTYAAPAQALFDAWTSPEVMRRWFHAGGEDWENIRAELDLRVGGRLEVAMRTPEGVEHAATGEYTVIEPPERLAFTWTWTRDEGTPAADTMVELEFTERDGATTVVLTHSGLVSEESARNHSEGWSQVLENLGRALGA